MNTRAYCNYYGELEGELLGNNLGLTMVDEAYQRILDKHEDRLFKDQGKIISDLKKTFSDELKRFNKELSFLSKRVVDLEKNSKRDKKEDVKKRTLENDISKG